MTTLKTDKRDENNEGCRENITNRDAVDGACCGNHLLPLLGRMGLKYMRHRREGSQRQAQGQKDVQDRGSLQCQGLTRVEMGHLVEGVADIMEDEEETSDWPVAPGEGHVD